MSVLIRAADFDNPMHCNGLIEIIDSYAQGSGGQSAPLSPRARQRMISGLREHPAALVLLALQQDRPIGAAVCFWGFSTFAGAPLLNVHDLAVLPEQRGEGIGTRLLEAAERQVREQGGCRVTLEVLSSNESAQRLYRRLGFGPWDEPALFLSKDLSHDSS